MKTFFLAALPLCVISFVNGVATGTTTSATSSSTSFPAPKGFQPTDVTVFGDPNTNQPDTTADAMPYWVCLAISPSTFNWGVGWADSKSSALSLAEKECGEKDCNKFWMCRESGCIGLDFGLNAAWVSSASDASEAEKIALADCKAHDYYCGKPGYFCSA